MPKYLVSIFGSLKMLVLSVLYILYWWEEPNNRQLQRNDCHAFLDEFGSCKFKLYENWVSNRRIFVFSPLWSPQIIKGLRNFLLGYIMTPDGCDKSSSTDLPGSNPRVTVSALDETQYCDSKALSGLVFFWFVLLCFYNQHLRHQGASRHCSSSFNLWWHSTLEWWLWLSLTCS